MKLKTQLTVLLSFVVFNLFAQTTNYYQELYNQKNLINDNIDIDAKERFCIYCTNTSYFANNDSKSMFWSGSSFLEAQILMYEYSSEDKYSEIIKSNIDSILAKREDVIDGNPLKRKAWSTNFYNTACPNFNGEIHDEQWHNENYTTCNICSDKKFHHPNMVGNANIIYNLIKFYNVVSEKQVSQDIQNCADNALTKALETYDYIEQNFWYEGADIYPDKNVNNDKGAFMEYFTNNQLEAKNVLFNYEKTVMALNIQSAFGRVLIQLHKVFPNNQNYINKIQKLSNHIKAFTKVIDNRKQWTYTGYPDPKKCDYNGSKCVEGAVEYEPNTPNPGSLEKPLRDDLTHSALTAIFPLECFLNNIPNTFTKTDVEQYANTLLQDIYIETLTTTDGVHDGHTINRKTFDFKTNYFSHTDDIEYKEELRGQVLYEYWVEYAQIKPEIYNLLNDFNTSIYYRSYSVNNKKNYSSNYSMPLALALLYKHRQRFAPISSMHGWGRNSNWSGVAAGHFDNDFDNEEFAYVRNYNNDKSIRVGKLMKDTGLDFSTVRNSTIIKNIAATIDDYNDYEWVSVGTGDFYGDDRDDVIALSNHPTDASKNGCVFFELNDSGNILEFRRKLSNNSLESDWVGVTGGNFIIRGKDEYITARNLGLELSLQSISENNNSYSVDVKYTLHLKDLNLGLSQSNGDKIAAIASGNLLHGSQYEGEELAVLINSKTVDQQIGGSLSGLYIFGIKEVNRAYKFELLYKSTGWGANSDFKGLSIGDYDADGKDDILMHRNLDGIYRLYTLDDNNGSLEVKSLGSEFFPKNQSNDGIVASGNLDESSHNDEIVVLRKDGGIVAYTYLERVLSNTSPLAESIEAPVQKVLNNKLEQVVVYPNPNKGIINLKTSKIINGVALKDYNGRSINLNYNEGNKTINMSSLSSGIYFLSVELEGGKIEVKKVIKN